jgi:organic radical activating enzyme
LACRYCNPTDSSSWHEPAVFLGLADKKSKSLLIAGKNEFDIYNQIAEHSNSLDRIYFAGGEPLIIEQFYKIVQLLDQRGRHDVELIYNTNMTKSGLKTNSIFDLWKNFKKISIGASLDGEGIRGEYLRSNTKWADVVNFRKEMIKQRPDIDFYISATTSIMNVLHVPDFHRSWVEQGLIAPEDFNIQLLKGPHYFNVNQAPHQLKVKIKQKYQDHIDWLKNKDTVGRATYGFESILKYIDTDLEFDKFKFWTEINKLDEFHKTSFVETFPELNNLGL